MYGSVVRIVPASFWACPEDVRASFYSNIPIVHNYQWDFIIY